MDKNNRQQISTILKKVSLQLAKEINRHKYPWNIENCKIILFELINTYDLILKLRDEFTGEDEIQNYKTSSYHSLCRNFNEGFDRILYLLVNLPNDENKIKELLWKYQTEQKKMNLSENLGTISQEKERRQKILDDIKETFKFDLIIYLAGKTKNPTPKKGTIYSSPIESLDKKEKKAIENFLKSKEEQLYKSEDVYKMWDIDDTVSDANFNHTSQFTHFTPMGINQMDLRSNDAQGFIEFWDTAFDSVNVFFAYIIKLISNAVKIDIEDENDTKVITELTFILSTTGIQINFFKKLTEKEIKLFINFFDIIFTIKFNEARVKNLFIHRRIFVMKGEDAHYWNEDLEDGKYEFGFIESDTEIKYIGSIEIKDKEIIKINPIESKEAELITY